MKYKGHWLENVHVDGPWHCIKQGEACLHGYQTVLKAREQIGVWFRCVNAERPCEGLDYLMRDDVFYRRKSLPKAA